LLKQATMTFIDGYAVKTVSKTKIQYNVINKYLHQYRRTDLVEHVTEMTCKQQTHNKMKQNIEIQQMRILQLC